MKQLKPRDKVTQHFLCLLRFFFSATKTLPTRPTARKIRNFSEKGQKNKRALRPSGKTENGGCFHTSPVSFADCSIFSAPSIAPSMTGK